VSSQTIPAGPSASRGLRSIVRTWGWFMLGGTLIGLVVAVGVAALTPPTYTAHVTLLVAPYDTTTGGVNTSDLEVAQALIPTFAELATTTPVLDRAISSTNANTNAQALAEAVSTHIPAGTNLLEISVSDRDPAQASDLAEAIASDLQVYAPPNPSDANVAKLVALTIVDPATAPTSRDGPGFLIRVALGGAIALFLTISIAFLGENVWQRRGAFRSTPDGPAPSVASQEPEAVEDAQGGPYAVPAWWRRARAAQTSLPPTWPSTRGLTSRPDSTTDDLVRPPIQPPRDVPR
jgi:capsular polysaccharide biosynthesis protein